MKRVVTNLTAILLVLGAFAFAPKAMADGVSQAIDHSATGSANIFVGGVEMSESGFEVVAGTVAIPVWVAGEVIGATGNAAADVGEDLWDFATDPTDTRPPLDRDIGHVPTESAPAPTDAPLSPADALNLNGTSA